MKKVHKYLRNHVEKHFIENGKTLEDVEAYINSLVSVEKEKGKPWVVKTQDGKTHYWSKKGCMPSLVDIWG